MSITIRFISDLHFDHKNICHFSGDLRKGNNSEQHDEWLIDQWNSVVNKRDIVWVLGDISFSKDGINKVSRLNGKKNLILGNHDKFQLSDYKTCFEKIHGFIEYKGFWLSHAPIKDTRGKINIHGHTHSSKMIDGMHFCVCVEALQGKPISMDQIKHELLKNGR